MCVKSDGGENTMLPCGDTCVRSIESCRGRCVVGAIYEVDVGCKRAPRWRVMCLI